MLKINACCSAARNPISTTASPESTTASSFRRGRQGLGSVRECPSKSIFKPDFNSIF